MELIILQRELALNEQGKSVHPNIEEPFKLSHLFSDQARRRRLCVAFFYGFLCAIFFITHLTYRDSIHRTVETGIFKLLGTKQLQAEVHDMLYGRQYQYTWSEGDSTNAALSPTIVWKCDGVYTNVPGKDQLCIELTRD